ncbi:MAG: riboflavin synthase [Bacillota bacterium]|nr:riboflavin synthase [Bacillota bacterium]
MFTGLIEELGRCRAVEVGPGGGFLGVEAPGFGAHPGESVAVNGVCLTVLEAERGRLAFEVMPETLRVTTLGRLRPGAPVNLERALRLGDRLGGHLVQGHVDGVGEVVARERQGDAWWLRIRAPEELRPFLARKGSVAVDGVSLTVAALEEEVFAVSLTPTTARRTTLGERRPRDPVNLEVDLLARYLARLLAGAEVVRP